MKVGDHVDVSISTGEKVGPGKVTAIISDDGPMVSITGIPTVRVTVERPRGGPYEFGASRSFFRQVGPDKWELNMPATTRKEFLLDEEED